jgi:hypothetical protein
LLPDRLQFLFAQYGRLEHITQLLISKYCGAWNSYLIKKYIYVFTYNTPNLKNKVLILDLINRDPYKPNTISFRLLCL